MTTEQEQLFTVKFSHPTRGSHERNNLTKEAAAALAKIVRRDKGKAAVEPQEGGASGEQS